MTTEVNLHAALMTGVELMTTGYTVIWPQKGDAIPSGEHIQVSHVPNNTTRRFIGSTCPRDWKGFVVLLLVSDLGEYEVVTKRKAGEITAQLPIDTDLTVAGESVNILNHTVKQGRQVEGRWETPIWLEYEAYL